MTNHSVPVEQVSKVISRIVEIRKEKNLTLENMALELNMSVSAYHKIEKQETALKLEMLFQIQKALDVPISDLLEINSGDIYHQTLHDSAIGHQVVKNQYNQDSPDLIDKMFDTLNGEIQFLREQLKANLGKQLAKQDK